MDVDRFISTNQASWQRLDALVVVTQRGVRHLSASDLDEMIYLYQRVSGHLSIVRTQYREPNVTAELTRILSRARGVIYRRRTNPVVALGHWVTETFPAAVWSIRGALAVAAFALIAPALATGIWLARDTDARDALITPEQAQLVAEEDFENYYKSDAASNFQAKVTVNNIQVSFLAFASGIFLGLPSLYLLASNGVNVGVAAAVMHANGEGAQFWGLITPHGLLELTSIIVAGAAGLRLGWALISPGDRRRSEALSEEGLRCVSIATGLLVTFLIAGFIEAWVTPSDLPTAIRIAVGVAVEVAFIGYVVGFGRAAEARGLTGRLGEDRPVTASRSVRAAPST